MVADKDGQIGNAIHPTRACICGSLVWTIMKMNKMLVGEIERETRPQALPRALSPPLAVDGILLYSRLYHLRILKFCGTGSSSMFIVLCAQARGVRANYSSHRIRSV